MPAHRWRRRRSNPGPVQDPGRTDLRNQHQSERKDPQRRRKEVKKGELAVAGKQFSQAATALKTAYVQIKAVPQPSADAAKLTKWLSYVNEEIDLFKAGAAALNGGSKNKAQTIVAKLTHTATLANNEVISFGFRYCKLEPSKFP